MCQSIERDDLVCCVGGKIGSVIAIVGEGERSPSYYLMFLDGNIRLVMHLNTAVMNAGKLVS